MTRWLIFFALAGLMVGCSSDPGGDEIVRTGQAPPKVRPNGSLTSDPPPLTLRSVEARPEGSVERAVLELWFWGQWGSSPNMAAMHDREVLARVGATEITDGYALLRGEMITGRPRVVVDRQSPGGRFVGIEIQRKDQPPARESYMLRRRGGTWAILYDSMLERGVTTAAHRRAGITPGKDLTSRAQSAGDAAASQYREASALAGPL